MASFGGGSMGSALPMLPLCILSTSRDTTLQALSMRKEMRERERRGGREGDRVERWRGERGRVIEGKRDEGREGRDPEVSIVERP